MEPGGNRQEDGGRGGGDFVSEGEKRGRHDSEDGGGSKVRCKGEISKSDF